MNKPKSLGRYEKIILAVLAALFVVFTAVYFVISPRKGFEYNNAVLIPRTDGTDTVYSGRVKGETAAFTVTEDKTVTLVWGDKTYGPYTARKDATAVPKDSDFAEYLTGIEIMDGEEVLFRGGVMLTGIDKSQLVFFAEDGEDLNIGFTYSVNGVEYNMDGSIVDPMKPKIWDIVNLMKGPQLINRGEWLLWLLGAFFSAMTAVSIIYADEIFCISMSFRIRNADDAQPSEWHIATRYIGWTLTPVMALVLYIMGLTLWQ